MSEERGPRGLEWVLLSVMAVIAAFAVLVTGGIRAVDFAIIEYLMVAALGLSVVRLWVHEKPVFHLSPVLWPVLAFTAYVGLRAATATVPYLAEDEFTRVLFYAAFFVIFTFHIFRPQYSQAMLVVIVTVAVGASLYAAYQYFTGSNMVWHFYRPGLYGRRGSGTFINPNNFAGYVAVLLPMMIAVVIVGRVNITTRCLAGYAALMFLLGLTVAASRGALVAAAGGVLALVIMLVRQKVFRMAALVLLAVMVLGSMAVLSQTSLAQLRFQQMNNLDLSTDTRVLLWESAEGMWRDNPWLGVGPGHYDAVFPQYRSALLQHRKPYFAHNEYLNTLADYGLVGALLILVSIGTLEFAFHHGWRGLRRDASNMEGARSNRLALLFGASAGITVALIHALFDFDFHLPAYALLIVFFMGLLAVCWRADNSRWWWRPQGTGKTVLTLLCLALAGWFSLHATKRLQEAGHLDEAKAADHDSTAYLQALEAAAQVEPKNSRTLYDIGEYHRAKSWLDKPDFKAEGKLALEWYAKAAQLDPLDSYIPLRQGMTLAWVREKAEAEPYLAAAQRLNPNDYYTLSLVGWGYYELNKYQEARRLFERSIQLRPYDNQVSVDYLPRTLEHLRTQPAEIPKP